jgi:hypothetical protein
MRWHAWVGGVALALSGMAGAQVTAFWNSPVSGNWTNGSLWSSAPDFPNNGLQIYDVVINVGGTAYTVTLDQNITIRDFTIDSVDATLGFGGSFQLTVERDFLLRAGARLDGTTRTGHGIVVAGTATFEDGSAVSAGTVRLNGPVAYAMSTMFDIDDTGIDHGDGSAIWASPGSIRLSNGGTITNEATCTFTITSASATLLQGAGAQGSFSNAGTIIRDAGAGVIDLQGVQFANSGTLEVRTGTFRTDGVQLVANTLDSGTWVVAGGDIDLVGQTISTNQADVRFTTATGNFPAFASVATNGASGRILIDGGRTFTTGGGFQNDGRLEVGASSLFDVAGTLGNVQGSTLVGGEFVVRGTVRATNLAGITNLNASVTLDGAASGIVGPGNVDALTGLATIDTQGELEVLNGRNFTTTGNLTLNGQGRLAVGVGTTFTVNGTITNLASGTFTDGALDVAGRLVFNGADIQTVAGSLSLNDPNARIEDEQGQDAFRNLSTVSAPGSLAITNGRNLTVTGSLSNAGSVTIGTLGNGSTLTLQGAYNQSAGTTTLRDGVIDAPGGFNLAGGELRGSGLINGQVVSNGTIKPGNSPGELRIIGGTEIRDGSLVEFEIAGAIQGAQYDFLHVLQGDFVLDALGQTTMRIALFPDFFPALGDRFTIVQTDLGSVRGMFSVIEGTDLSNGYRLAVEYVRRDEQDPNSVWRIDVVVTAVPAPASALVLGALGVAALRRRRVVA